MKPELASTRSRYRNEVVYRSAERLLASRPPMPSRKAPPPRLVFLLGVLCGVAIAAALIWPVREITWTVVNNTSRPSGSEHRTPSWPRAKAPTDSKQASATSAVATVSEPAQATTAEPAPTSVASNPSQPAAREPGAAIVTKNPSRPAVAPRQPAYPVVGLRFLSLLKLQGRMLWANGRHLDIEFELFPVPSGRSAVISGSARIFDRGTLVSYHRLNGRRDGFTIFVAEPMVPAGGRTFEIDLPTDPKDTHFIGTWTRGNDHGWLALTSVRTF